MGKNGQVEIKKCDESDGKAIKIRKICEGFLRGGGDFCVESCYARHCEILR